jgi:hypothetical protein
MLSRWIRGSSRRCYNLLSMAGGKESPRLTTRKETGGHQKVRLARDIGSKDGVRHQTC